MHIFCYNLLLIDDNNHVFAPNLDATTSVRLLPAYDIERTQKLIESTSKELKACEDIFQPKKKFKFSRSKNKDKDTDEKSVKPTQVSASETISNNTIFSKVASNSSKISSLALKGSYSIMNRNEEDCLVTASTLLEFLSEEMSLLSSASSPTLSLKNVNISIKHCKNSKISA